MRLPLHLSGSERERAPSMPDAIRGWGVWLEAQGYSADTRRRYIDTITAIGHECEWESVTDATTSDISAWFAENAVENEWSGRTYNNRLSGVRTFFGWVKDNRWRGENPAENVAGKKHVEGDGVREFTLDEMRRIIAATDGRRRAAYILGATTGLRKSNVCLNPDLPTKALRWGWVNLRTRTLRFPADTMKNHKPHEIPITEEAAAALAAIRPESPDPTAPVFPFWVDNRTLRGDMLAAGVERVTEQGERAAFHSFRKGYLTALADAGVHPKTTQELAGHSDIKLTMKVYTKARMERKRAAVQNYSVLPSPDQTATCAEPRGMNPENSVDTAGRMPEDMGVRLQHPKPQADSPAAPCVEGPAGSLTTSDGSRRGGPSGCRVSGFPGSASSGMTPRGFEPRGMDRPAGLTESSDDPNRSVACAGVSRPECGPVGVEYRPPQGASDPDQRGGDRVRIGVDPGPDGGTAHDQIDAALTPYVRSEVIDAMAPSERGRLARLLMQLLTLVALAALLTRLLSAPSTDAGNARDANPGDGSSITGAP